MACWITFFADGARRNSSRWVLYSRFGDAGFLRADGMVALLGCLYGNSPCMTRGGARPCIWSQPVLKPTRPALRMLADPVSPPPETPKRQLLPVCTMPAADEGFRVMTDPNRTSLDSRRLSPPPSFQGASNPFDLDVTTFTD